MTLRFFASMGASAMLFTGPLAAASLAVTPAKGSWRGTTSQGGPVNFTVKGKKIANVDVGVVMTCIDGGPNQQFRHKFKFKAAIKKGRFELHKREAGFAIDLSGQFTSKTKARGTVDMSHGTCLSGNVAFTAAH